MYVFSVFSDSNLLFTGRSNAVDVLKVILSGCRALDVARWKRLKGNC